MDLKRQLEKAETQGFIPLKGLQRLINAKSVRDYFSSKNVKISREGSEEISLKAPRLFAINVLLDRGWVVQEYLSKHCDDKDLPFFQSSDIPEIGSTEYRSRLYRKQWVIPTILQPTEHRNFPTGFIPPITYEDKQMKNRGGKFGQVHKVKVADGHLAGHSTRQPLALKEIRILPDNAHTIMREVQTLQERRHDLIVPLIASWTEPKVESEYEVTFLYLLFPWARMDLHEWLYLPQPPRDWEGKDQGILKEYIYRSILSISGAVTFVHREIAGFISSHHDIKPKNILLFGQTWKLADFGRTHLLRAAQVSDTEGTLGTYTYQPPEYRNSLGAKAEKRHGRAFDVWSLGCITIEFATIAVYGWKDEKLRKSFRDKRLLNQDRPKGTPANQEGQDDSFSNNMNIVRDWTRQLLHDDQSSDLKSMLRIAETMMTEEEGLRYLSWEVYLDLYELLHPNGTTEETETETRAVVQRPSRHHEKTEHHPLRRAYEQGNKPRVKELLKTGWAGHPLNLLEIDKEDPSEIVKWICTAKAMQGLSWRRLLYKTIPPSLIAKARASSQSHENQRPDLGPSTRIGAEVERAFVSSRPPTAFKKGSVYPDEHGMTEMHLECQNAHFWHVLQYSEKTSPQDWNSIMTHEDSAGWLPLHHAANSGPSQIINYLLKSFSLNSTVLAAWPDHENRTPLHLASQRGDIDAIRSLLHAHKDPVQYSTLKDKRNRTACDVALHYGHNNAYELLSRILGGNQNALRHE